MEKPVPVEIVLSDRFEERTRWDNFVDLVTILWLVVFFVKTVIEGLLSQ